MRKPSPAHPQKDRFLCCLSSHLLLLQQVAKDRIVLGLDLWYKLLLCTVSQATPRSAVLTAPSTQL